MLPPLQVDTDKAGKDSDHNTVILPPITISNDGKTVKRPVVTRPPMKKFEEFFCPHTWDEVLNVENKISLTSEFSLAFEGNR